MKHFILKIIYILLLVSHLCEAQIESRHPSDLSCNQILTKESERIFNNNIHRLVLRVSRQTDETVRDRGQDRNFKQYGRLLSLCFFQNDHDIKPEVCLSDVAYRVRGNSSRTREKRQFNIKFNAHKNIFENNLKEWVPESKSELKRRTLFGLSSFNLRSGGLSSHDLSMIREPLASFMFSKMVQSSARGPLVYKTAYAKVFLQYCDEQGLSCLESEYKGVYYMTESINDDFLTDRFGSARDGLLFSPTFDEPGKIPDLTVANFHPRAYKLESESKENLKKKIELAGLEKQYKQCQQLINTNPTPNSQPQLKAALFLCSHLVKLEEISRSSHLATELAELFDLESVMSYMAAVNLVGHWDSLLGNSNNDKLYFNSSLDSRYGGKWQILTWDLDLTFGAMSDETRKHKAHEFKLSLPSLLFQLILKDPILRDRYKEVYRQRLADMPLKEVEAKFEEFRKNVIDATHETDESPPSPADFESVRSYIRDRYHTLLAK